LLANQIFGNTIFANIQTKTRRSGDAYQ